MKSRVHLYYSLWSCSQSFRALTPPEMLFRTGKLGLCGESVWRNLSCYIWQTLKEFLIQTGGRVEIVCRFTIAGKLYLRQARMVGLVNCLNVCWELVLLLMANARSLDFPSKWKWINEVMRNEMKNWRTEPKRTVSCHYPNLKCPFDIHILSLAYQTRNPWES